MSYYIYESNVVFVSLYDDLFEIFYHFVTIDKSIRMNLSIISENSKSSMYHLISNLMQLQYSTALSIP